MSKAHFYTAIDRLEHNYIRQVNYLF